MTNTPRPNRYAGTCSVCSAKVAAGAGTLGPKVGGRWTTRCAAHSPAPVARRVADDDGYNAYKDARCVDGTWSSRKYVGRSARW